MKRVLLWTGLMTAGALYAQEIELQVELSSQVATATARKGDPVAATVLSPAALAGDTVEGKVTEARSGAKLGGQSVLTIDFDLLKHGGTRIPINSQLKSAANSKGRVNVDEEGRVLKRGTSNVAKAGTGAGLGGLQTDQNR